MLCLLCHTPASPGHWQGSCCCTLLLSLMTPQVNQSKKRAMKDGDHSRRLRSVHCRSHKPARQAATMAQAQAPASPPATAGERRPPSFALPACPARPLLPPLPAIQQPACFSPRRSGGPQTGPVEPPAQALDVLFSSPSPSPYQPCLGPHPGHPCSSRGAREKGPRCSAIWTLCRGVPGTWSGLFLLLCLYLGQGHIKRE